MKKAPLLAVAALLGLLRAADAGDAPIPADVGAPRQTPKGVTYSVLQEGREGTSPKEGDAVTVHYTGWLTNGTVFDSSRARQEPAVFGVGQLIPGWNEALTLMTPGARWKLTIPPELGYGAKGSPPAIPANATLVFDVELIEVVPFRALAEAAAKKTESGIGYEIEKPGEGEPPAPTDGVEFHFVLWNEKGKFLQSSRSGGRPVQGRPADFPIPFVKEALGLLRPGGVARFDVPPALGFGARDQGQDLPPNSPTKWRIELLKVDKPMPLPKFEMSPPEKTTTTPSGLKIEVLREGKGASPKMGEEVTVHYAGWLTDGKLFDASYNRGAPMSFRLGQVIDGWNEGLQTMKVGGMVRLTIPPALGYGARGAGSDIPPNATLVFVVELIKVGR